jgi:predicted metal-dependent phosphoesterase TrpH
MPIDLHTHSTASDGSQTPSEIVTEALELGLSTVALTDHDTQEGLGEARKTAENGDIDLIAGTELSLAYPKGGMHLIVLWLEPGPGPLQDRLSELQDGRKGRNERIVATLTSLGMEVTIEEVEEQAGGGSVGRPHIAAVMVNKGHVESITEAFDLWLGNDRPAYAGRPRLAPTEAIGLARESGSVPILAHPHTLNITNAAEMSDLLRELRGAGLVGLEAIYGSYRQHERDGYTDLARRFDLIASGGSDYHGSYKPGLQLGTGYGDLIVPDSLADELHQFAITP